MKKMINVKKKYPDTPAKDHSSNGTQKRNSPASPSWNKVWDGFWTILVFDFSVVFLGIKLIHPISHIAYRIFCFVLATTSFLISPRFNPQKESYRYFGLLFFGFFYLFHIGINLYDYRNPLILGIWVGVGAIIHILFRKKIPLILNSFNMVFLVVGSLVLFIMITYPDRLLFRSDSL